MKNNQHEISHVTSIWHIGVWHISQHCNSIGVAWYISQHYTGIRVAWYISQYCTSIGGAWYISCDTNTSTMLTNITQNYGFSIDLHEISHVHSIWHMHYTKRAIFVHTHKYVCICIYSLMVACHGTFRGMAHVETVWQ